MILFLSPPTLAPRRWGYWFAWDWDICIVPFVALCDSLCCCGQEVQYVQKHTQPYTNSFHHAVVYRFFCLPIVLCSLTTLCISLLGTSLCLQWTEENLRPQHTYRLIRLQCIRHCTCLRQSQKHKTAEIQYTCGRRSLVTLSTQWLHSLSVLRGAGRQLSEPAMMQSFWAYWRRRGVGAAFGGDIRCLWRQHSTSSYIKRLWLIHNKWYNVFCIFFIPSKSYTKTKTKYSLSRHEQDAWYCLFLLGKAL